jgi:hypothetical protein
MPMDPTDVAEIARKVEQDLSNEFEPCSAAHEHFDELVEDIPAKAALH